ncbi:MAG: HPr(Ser) kinase/phosphatase [Ignavibacteriaceae bacterium]|nr:HPr(Ser) kinase/phosphatase [Ignavibacteriaceae bacterium]NUM71733.1 HPr(Ser) kinase/phosphatase [Ignavibacteriaceae bacterium]
MMLNKPYIDVGFFYNGIKDRFKVNLLSNENGFERRITDQNLHRPGLALAGFVDLFSYSRVQIIGNTEMRYLSKLTNEDRLIALERLFRFPIPCIILTDNNKPLPEMLEFAEKNNVSIFGSTLGTTKLMYFLTDFLDDQFAPSISQHGSFVDVYGVGILFIGDSGIGKSEVALDLVERGHRLVADDMVILTKKGEGILMGTGTQLARHIMEIRGLGFVNVEKMFGIRAIRFQKRLEVIVQLKQLGRGDEDDITRTGLENSLISLLDVELPLVKLPIIPGKNITVISEVIALNYLLKHYGYDPSVDMQERLRIALEKKMRPGRGTDYFEHDFE